MRSGRWRIERHRELPSTQEALRARLLATAPADLPAQDGLCLVAERQSAGRGRRGNYWLSPPGGLWCSFCCLLPGGPDPLLGLLAAAAARSAVLSLCALEESRLGIKWPNDLIDANGAKWGGVLAETRATSQGTATILGVGLNLDVPAQAFVDLGPIDPRPTSLRALLGHSPSPEAVLFPLLDNFATLLAQRGSPPGPTRLEPVRCAMFTLGRRVRWTDPDGQVTAAVARDLDPDGALRVVLDDGSERVLHSAVITHLRT